jgi:hypothetical protein
MAGDILAEVQYGQAAMEFGHFNRKYSRRKNAYLGGRHK